MPRDFYDDLSAKTYQLSIIEFLLIMPLSFFQEEPRIINSTSITFLS